MPAITRCQRFAWFGLFVFGLITTTSGCRLFQDPKIAPPLSFQQQRDMVYRIAPIGTHRDEAVVQLRKAGITGEFAPHVVTQYKHDPRVFYCQLHDEKDGGQRQMTIAILFDDQKKLYGVSLSDLAESDTPISDITTTSRPQTGLSSGDGFPTRSTIPIPQSAEPTSNPTPDQHNPRFGTRSPFGNDGR